MQPTVTEELVLRGRFQTLPIAIYGWAISTHAPPEVCSNDKWRDALVWYAVWSHDGFTEWMMQQAGPFPSFRDETDVLR